MFFLCIFFSFLFKYDKKKKNYLNTDTYIYRENEFESWIFSLEIS